MIKFVIQLILLVLINISPVWSFAEEETPCAIGAPILEGDGWPDGSYDVVISPDAN